MRKVLCVILVILGVVFVTGGLPASTTADQDPGRLADKLTSAEFWQLTVALSEPDATFFSDNLVSNEMSFAQVVPQLRAAVRPGGVYLGVGPEQNFTYLAAVRARFAFIVDLRRANLLLHLMYKALFELSPNRAAFLSRLFSRSASGVGEEAGIGEIMTALSKAPADDSDVHLRNLADLRRVLLDRHQFALTPDDWAAIEKAYDAFRRFGPSLGYSTTQIGRPFGTATYANLMQQTGADGEPLSYLGSEVSYLYVRDLHLRNVIVPVVGNFAGPRAIRGIGSFLRTRNATVTAFYLSNVEDYLGLARVPKNGEWPVFCENAASLPRDAESVFIRPHGLAVYTADGSLTLRKDMQIGDRPADAVTLGRTDQAQFPSALSPISDDVKACGG
jgi:hypothetical protein